MAVGPQINNLYGWTPIPLHTTDHLLSAQYTHVWTVSSLTNFDYILQLSATIKLTHFALPSPLTWSVQRLKPT